MQQGIAKVPPFVSVGEALAWALRRLEMAGVPSSAYFRHAREALGREQRGAVFTVVRDCDESGQANQWHVACSGQPTGIVYTQETSFPQAKAAEQAACLDYALRLDLQRFHRRARVEALRRLGLDPYRVMLDELQGAPPTTAGASHA